MLSVKYANSCLADPAPDNPVCDAAEIDARRADDRFAELIGFCQAMKAKHPDFGTEWDKLGDALDDCRHDWLTGGVYAEIENRRTS